MKNNLTLVNKISLLALLALLAGTGSGVIFTLIFAFSLIFTAVIIKFIYSIDSNFFSSKKGELILWGTGLGISYLLYIILPQLFQSQAQYFDYYFILIGATPLLYAELENKNWSKFMANNLLFLDLMIAVSIARELLGTGSVLDYQIFVKAPLSLAAEVPGAFLILGIVAFIYDAVIKKFNLERKIKKETESQLESEVKA